jgi:hypothetical protein
MERKKKNGDLYIDPVVDQTQRWILTADMEGAARAWDVLFGLGGCGPPWLWLRRLCPCRAFGTVGRLVLCLF